MEYPAFVGGSYKSQSYVADQEDLINRYIEVLESEGATRKTALFPTPGVQSFASATAVGCRGVFKDEETGRVFAVFFNTLFEFTAGAVVTSRGTVATDSNPVTFAANGAGGDQLFITSGGRGYNYALPTNTLTQVIASDATMGGFLDGYFISFGANQIRISDLYDGTVWDPTQYLARSTGADPWRAMLVTPYYQIVLPGAITGDILGNVGTFPFPFAPDKSGSFAEGIAAPFSLQQTGKTTAWISTNSSGGYQVLASTGFNPQRISNHAMERAMAGYTTLSDAIGQTYEQEGHAFLLLTFPTAAVTWCYDFSTQLWHKRGTWISEENKYIYSRAVFHCFAFGKHLMGDREGTTLYEMTDTVSTDVDGRVLRWLRRAPAIQDEHKRIVVNRIEILMDTGIGLSGTGQGSDPLLMIRASRDFGQTFGAERQLKIGKQGEYWRRVYATRFGAGRGWVFEVSGSDPVPMRVSGAFLDVERLAA